MTIRAVDSSLVRDLKRSLIERGAAKPIGATWGEFVLTIQAMGVRPEDLLSSIEVGIAQSGSGYVLAERTEDGWEVREL